MFLMLRTPKALRVVMFTAGLLLLSATAGAQTYFKQPPPGSIYREYTKELCYEGSSDCTVLDPNIDLDRYPDLASSLPNPTIGIFIGDLQNAVRAEVLIDFWGGHLGTYGKKVQFNGNPWIDIPEIPTIAVSPECYCYQSNVVVDIPLSNLVEGPNTFQGMNSGQTCYNIGWGQHSWYGVIVRVYYNSNKPHPTGQITSPANGGLMQENPVITMQTSAGVDRVDMLAFYDGYDTDGDGVYQQWHESYHRKIEDPMIIQNHVGTSTVSPFGMTWNTSMVPDQVAGGVKLCARIRDASGIWYVTPAVENLSLQRVGTSVRLYKATGLTEGFVIRNDYTMSHNVPIDGNIADATEAMMLITTWNGINGAGDPPGYYTKINDYTLPDGYGQNHAYSYDIIPFPPSALFTGENKIEWYVQSVHHGIEVLWPGAGMVVKYSGSYASPKPATADLASPPSGNTSQPVSLTVRWHPAPGAATYDLQVATDSLFGSPVVNLTGLTDTTRAIGPLTNLTKYYWRVRGVNAAGTGNYSSKWNFSTFLAAPSLVAPANGTLGVPVVPALRWRSGALATGYHVQIATDSVFSAPAIVKDSVRADTTWSPAGLSNSTLYYWRVSATTGGGEGAYSSVWHFTTVLAPAATPALISPANNALNAAVSLPLLWNRSATASSYHVQVATDAPFAGTLVVNDSLLTDTTRVVSGLSNDATYYWRARAKNAGGVSAFSAAWQFHTVVATPLMPVLLVPAQAATNQPTSGLQFSWAAITGAINYRFQLGTDSTFATGLFKNDTSLVDTTRLVSGLTINTIYYWHVGARNVGGVGPYSPTRYFRTTLPVPGAVQPLFPVHLAVLDKDTARFIWSTTTPASSRYWFEISLDSTFSLFTSIDSSLTDTTKIFRSLQQNASYFWRVRGGNAATWGAFGTRRQFSVRVTSVRREDVVPTEFTLGQNYPNPFNPSTRIEFGLPRETAVTLSVYNLLGEKVATLIEGTRGAGQYVVEFDASALSSGIYLYYLTGDGFSLFKKMLLVK